MSQLDTNPVVQILGFEHEQTAIHDVFLFFYAIAIVQSVKGKNFLHEGGVSLLRGFGSYGFFVPLVLGQLPSKMLKDFDQYFKILIGAQVFVAVVYDRLFPGDIQKHFNAVTNFAYSVIKGNAAGYGYVLVSTALGNSIAAPFIGAYLAVNGHRILEKGIHAVGATTHFDADSLLGIFGGLIYYALVEYVRTSALVARIALVAFRISCDYVDYNYILDNISGAIGSKSSAGRGRSRTPKRK